MKAFWKTLLTASVLAMAAFCIVSCQNDSSPESTSATGSSAETETAGVTTEAETTKGVKPASNFPVTYTVYHKTCYNAALDWNRQSQNISGTTDAAWWNITGCKKMGINFLNVFPNYRENNTSISGSSLIPGHAASIAEYTAAGLKASHDAGMTVVPSLPMCLMTVEQYSNAGLDWKQYASKKSNGSYATSSDGKTAYACINNPDFQELVRNASLVYARAGYDGVFYDANPYAYGAKFNCCCDHCRKEWAEYSKQVTGKEIAILTSSPDLSTETGRLFWQWRLDTYIDFVLDIQKQCREYNSSFTVWPNLGLNGTTQVYYTLKGMEDLMCEYGSNSAMVTPGDDSTLYFFRQYEAENPEKMLMSQFNSIDSQASPNYRWFTAYVEAIAGNGALMVPTTSKGTVDFYSVINGCNKMKEEDPEAFTDSASAAETAILYSWQNINAFTLKGTGTLSYAYNPSRKVASALAKVGIPFDYIIEEKNPTLESIKQYKTIIIADQYIIDTEFENVLTQYINEGGQVLILGSAFGSYYTETYGVKYTKRSYSIFEKWTGKAFGNAASGSVTTVGKGKVAYSRNYVSGTVDNTAVTNATFLELMETLGMYDLVRVTEDIAGNVETTLRSDATGDRWWLHLITYNSSGKYENKPITVTVTLPEGQTVFDVTGSSPTVTDSKMNLTWKQDGNKVTITAVIGLYTMIRIDKY